MVARNTMDRMSRKPKELTKKELSTTEGKFVTHFQELLAAQKMDKDAFVQASGIKDATVRNWLRANAIPTDIETLKIIAKVLKVKDYRMVLPPV